MSGTGGLKCWGRNLEGQIGNGTNDLRVLSPTNVNGLPMGVVEVSGGHNHTCALTSAGALCWGSGKDGKLGDGTESNRNAPVLVVEFP